MDVSPKPNPKVKVNPKPNLAAEATGVPMPRDWRPDIRVEHHRGLLGRPVPGGLLWLWLRANGMLPQNYKEQP
jgi:hypothetical protein